MPRHPLAGSERQPLPGAQPVGKSDPDERFEAAIVVRPRAGAALTERVKKLAGGDRSQRHLNREEYAQQFAADPADIAAVEQFASAHGLTVVQEDAGSPHRRSLSGTVAQFNAAFGVDLQQFEHAGGSYRGRTGRDPPAG